MAFGRFALTRPPRGRLPWLVIGGCAAGLAAIGGARALRHHHRCHHHRGDAVSVLHVELAPGQEALLGARSIEDAAPLFTQPEAPLARWYRVVVDGPADAAAARLEAMGALHAFAEPRVEPAAIDPGHGADLAAPGPSCPIKTPSYSPLQGYLGPAPGGIDAASLWALPGGRGQGVRFADVEGAWNTRHEDLPGERITLVAGPQIADRAWQQHGTAVVGEVAGKDNGLGVTGIAPDVDHIYVASIGRRGNVADALDRAQQALRAGDVLLIELQGMGPEGKWAPVELWQDAYDVIRLATARGVIVVEAAGNGNANLDDPVYRGAFDRARRDSGAILVGAGAPPRPGFVDRARLDFSNYGARVDVQGWGRRVATLDYGDLQACSERPDRHYTGEFSGTSSASPIVAGAALQLEAIAKARAGRPIAPAVLRALLRATGTPQADAPGAPRAQQIGPRPDVRAAVAALFGS